MLWHIVELRFPTAVSEADREGLEDLLRELPDRIEELRFLRVGRALEDPDVTGLLTGFDDEAGLEAYRVHPEHLPVTARMQQLGVQARRLDIETADPGDALPRIAG